MCTPRLTRLIALRRGAAWHPGGPTRPTRAARRTTCSTRLTRRSPSASGPACRYRLHLKAAGRPNFGRGQEVIERIAAARERGLDVTGDVYPYDAGSGKVAALMPPWALQGGTRPRWSGWPTLPAGPDRPRDRDRIPGWVNLVEAAAGTTSGSRTSSATGPISAGALPRSPPSTASSRLTRCDADSGRGSAANDDLQMMDETGCASVSGTSAGDDRVGREHHGASRTHVPGAPTRACSAHARDAACFPWPRPSAR